jgi:hypothetical protein
MDEEKTLDFKIVLKFVLLLMLGFNGKSGVKPMLVGLAANTRCYCSFTLWGFQDSAGKQNRRNLIFRFGVAK